MALELKRLSVEVESGTGATDEYAAAILTENGIYFEGFFAESVGVSWAELSRILEDPVAKALLEQAEILRK